MRFYHILHKNNIGHLLGTSRNYFRPPPKKKNFRKEVDNIYVHFRKVFVEFVVFLTKIWPTNIDFFSLTAKCWRGGCSAVANPGGGARGPGPPLEMLKV